MAPRATFRRRSRDRNPDSSTDHVSTKLISFQKPNLPPLQGTPSSRRQYSYGSGVEPLPAKRRGRGGDLASAVRGALIPRGRNGQEDVLTPKKTAAHSAPNVEEDVEDELARDENEYRASLSHEDDIEESILDAPGKPEPPGRSPDPTGYEEQESDLDDARSFDMENDYFDGATIDSIAGDVSPPPLSVPPVPSEPPFLRDLGDERSRGPTTTFERPTVATSMREAADSVPYRKGTTEVDHDDEHRQPSARSYANLWPSLKNIVSRSEVTALATPPETDSQLSLEAENSTRRSSDSRLEASQLSDRVSAEGGDDGGLIPVERATKGLRGAFSGGSKAQSNSRPIFSISPARHDTDLFQRTNERTKLFGLQSGTSRHSPRRTCGALPLRQAGRYDFEQERQRLSPDSCSEQDDDDEISWLQLLNPWTYLEPVWWSFQAILGRVWRGFLSMLRRAQRSLQSMRDSVVDSVSHLHTDSLQDHLTVAGSNLIYMVTAFMVLLLAVAVSRAAYENLPTKMSDFSMSRGNFPISLPTLGHVADRLGRFVPSWTRSLDDEWEEFPDLQGERSDDSRFQKIDDWRREIHRELGKMKKSSNLHELSIQKLDSVMPKVVHMALKDGKPVVAPEFWHAIRDLIHQDGSFLTLEKKGSEYDIANEGQWRSIVSKLTRDPAFASQLDQGFAKTENRLTKQLTGTLEDTLAERLPAFWDSWVANNERKISQAIGSALHKMELPGTPKELDARLNQLVKQHMGNSKGGGGGGGKLVTRSEFLRHVENEFAAHRAEIKAEMSELEPKLKQLVKDSIALAKDELPDGMVRAEVENLVKALVKKSLADMNLEALARGKIHAHWDQDLKNQINYFSPGAGARVDDQDPNFKGFTSPTYKPANDDVSRKLAETLKPISAIMAWLDDGDCWCGSRSMSHRNNPYDVRLSVRLAQTIIPQHVVVEHILPGATRDPDARPKDIEVYALIEDPETRERLRDFAAVHLPDDKEDWDWTPAAIPDSFVKIGQFVYEGAELHDGVHVHHLSPELLDLGAETDQVVIRATSNYGAKLHTCFYRVRLYGHAIEGTTETVPPAIVKSRSSWWSWI